jgi:hypothetical protein
MPIGFDGLIDPQGDPQDEAMITTRRQAAARRRYQLIAKMTPDQIAKARRPGVQPSVW